MSDVTNIHRLHDPLGLALGRIKAHYDVEASIAKANLAIEQWGHRTVVGTNEQLLTNGVEQFDTPLTTNAITNIVSTSAADTQDVELFSAYIATNDDLVLSIQRVTLTGTTPVTLPQPVARANRLTVITGAEAAGVITVEQADTTVHCTIDIGDGQSEKAAATVPFNYFALLTDFGATVLGPNKTEGTFLFQSKQPGAPWVHDAHWSLNDTTTNYVHDQVIPIVYPPNTDAKLTVTPGVTGSDMEGHFSGYLAIDLSTIGQPLPAPKA